MRTSDLKNDLGYKQLYSDYPIIRQLYILRFGSMFLGVIMDIIIIVLMVLSIIVLYNLLLVSVEKKTYEMGVIRMLGLKKKNITFIVIIQSLLFVLPGIILGLLLSIPGMVLVNEKMKEHIGVQISNFPSA